MDTQGTEIPCYVVEDLSFLDDADRFVVIDTKPDHGRKHVVDGGFRHYADAVARYLNATPGSAEAADARTALNRYWRTDR